MASTSEREAALASSDYAVDETVTLLLNLGQYYTQALKGRCQRNHGWSDDAVARVFRGYCQFMQLKLALEDFDAAILSPSPLVDLMWHDHLLDTAHYFQCCRSVSQNKLIHHNPDGGVNAAARATRIRNTTIALKARYPASQIDAEVWNIQRLFAASAGGAGVTPKQETSSRVVKKRSNSRSEDCNPIEARGQPPKRQRKLETLQITLRQMETAEEVFYNIERYTRMSKVFKAYAHWKGVHLSSLRFLLGGDRIDIDLTAKMLQLKNGDVIDVMLEQSGC